MVVAICGLVIAALACAGGAGTASAQDTAPADFYGVNGQALMDATRPGADPTLLSRQVGKIRETIGAGGWVRVNVNWGLIEPSRPVNGAHAYQLGRVDAIVAALAQRRLSASMLLLGAPSWAASQSTSCATGEAPAADLDSFAAMAGAMAKRYGPGGAFWAAHPESPYAPATRFELWNEPNWNGFWCPKPDPTTYAELLAKATDAVHAAAPGARAIMGGLVITTDSTQAKGMPTRDFLVQVLAAQPGLVDSLDGVGVHLYRGSAAGDLDSLAWFRSVLQGVGLGQTPVDVTEFGWPTQGSGYPTLPEAGRATQVAALTDVLWRTDCNVAGAAVQTWNSAEVDPTDGEDWFGIADPTSGDPYLTATAYGTEIALAEGRGLVALPSTTVPNCTPDTTIDSGPVDPTRNATPTFTFHASEPNTAFECSIDQGTRSYLLCPTGSYRPLIALADGSYTFRVRAINAVGKVDGSPATRTFTVDTRPPETVIDSGPAGPTSNPSPTFTFHATEPNSTLSCSLDQGTPAFSPCSGGSFQPAGSLADGSYTLRVRAIDAAGNVEPAPATRSFTVDTRPPESVIDSGPAGPTRNPSPTFTFHGSEPNSTLECSLDQGTPTYAPCPGGSYQPAAPLADGDYTLRVRATDAAGNVDPTPAARSFSVDRQPPESVIDSGPTGSTASTRPSFTFHSSEPNSTFACSLDQGTPAYSPCAGGSFQPAAALAEGAYTLRVRATDAAGNLDSTPATRSFTVDTRPPETVIDSGPAGPTRKSSPTFTFHSSEPNSTFACSIDRGTPAYSPCPGGSFEPAAALADGDYTLRVRAIDAAGNVDPTPAARSFSVDTHGPTARITSHPKRRGRSSKGTFKFRSDEPGSTFRCRIDQARFKPCSSPISYRLQRGRHKFRVRAIDAQGNRGRGAAYRFVVRRSPRHQAPTLHARAE